MIVQMREILVFGYSRSPHCIAAIDTAMSRFPERAFESIFFFCRSKIVLAVIFIPAEGCQGHLNFMALSRLPFLH